jgi:hypothetical protein
MFCFDFCRCSKAKKCFENHLSWLIFLSNKVAYYYSHNNSNNNIIVIADYYSALFKIRYYCD